MLPFTVTIPFPDIQQFFSLFHQTRTGSLTEKIICLSARDSHCQSRMFSDLSVVYLASSTLLYPWWVFVFLAFVITLPTAKLSDFQNASNPLQPCTSGAPGHLGVGNPNLPVHINLLKNSPSIYAVCTRLSSFLNY